MEEGIYDTPCSPNPGTCICHLPIFPTLRLRGLCEGSNIDTEYKLKYLNGSIVYMGVRGSKVKCLEGIEKVQFSRQVKFVSPLGQEGWGLTVNLASTTAYTSSGGSSFALGNHNWTIVNDAPRCKSQVTIFDARNIFKAEKYFNGKVSTLKLSVCTDGEFSCASGDCIRMEERCDQVGFLSLLHNKMISVLLMIFFMTTSHWQ